MVKFLKLKLKDLVSCVSQIWLHIVQPDCQYTVELYMLTTANFDEFVPK